MEDKKQYNECIARRLLLAMKQLDMKQADVVALATEAGYNLRQSTLSKMLSPPYTNMTLANVVVVGIVLKLNLNELLSFDSDMTVYIPEKEIKRPQAQSMFIVRADAPQMRAYLNRFNAYFFPTKSSDTEVLKGTLDFRPSEDYSKCLARFSFSTGKYDEKQRPIVKKYEGDLVLSPTMSAAYCTLKNDSIGEISYLLFSYIPILYEKLRCRLALVLTSSAGLRRMPTVHRMLLTEDSCKLSDDEIAIIQGQLFLNESEILISEAGLDKFLADPRLDQEFKLYFSKPEENIKLAGVSSMPYYRFDESIIRDSFLDPQIKLTAINLIRQYSSAQRYNKIGDKSDDLLFKFVLGLEDNSGQ